MEKVVSCTDICEKCDKYDTCLLRHVVTHIERTKGVRSDGQEKDTSFYDLSSHEHLVQDILRKIHEEHSLFNLINAWSIMRVRDSDDGIGWRLRRLVEDCLQDFSGKDEMKIRAAYRSLGAVVSAALNEKCTDKALCRRCLITGSCFLERKL